MFAWCCRILQSALRFRSLPTARKGFANWCSKCTDAELGTRELLSAMTDRPAGDKKNAAARPRRMNKPNVPRNGSDAANGCVLVESYRSTLLFSPAVGDKKRLIQTGLVDAADMPRWRHSLTLRICLHEIMLRRARFTAMKGWSKVQPSAKHCLDAAARSMQRSAHDTRSILGCSQGPPVVPTGISPSAPTCERRSRPFGELHPGLVSDRTFVRQLRRCQLARAPAKGPT